VQGNPFSGWKKPFSEWTRLFSAWKKPLSGWLKLFPEWFTPFPACPSGRPACFFFILVFMTVVFLRFKLFPAETQPAGTWAERISERTGFISE
jgi:hypothetical protein